MVDRADAGGHKAEQEAIERQVVINAPRGRWRFAFAGAAVTAAVQISEMQTVGERAPETGYARRTF